MDFTKGYTEARQKNQNYVEQISSFPLQRFLHKEGWVDTIVDDAFVFSHRNTWYDFDTFTEKFHTHNYYELVFYISGNVEYIIDNSLIKPSPYMVTWFKPGQLHTGRLLSPSQYERYIFYFSADFFNLGDRVSPVTDFMTRASGTHMILSKSAKDELLQILEKADNVQKLAKPYAKLVLKSLLIEIFYMLDSHEQSIQKGEVLTETAGKIKQYIDENYASIASISDVAEQFFYTREHLSRKFKQAFNMTAADYLTRRRITESIVLLDHMNIAEAAYSVGFRSQSAFINAFKNTMHCLPSEYKAKNKSLE